MTPPEILEGCIGKTLDAPAREDRGMLLIPKQVPKGEPVKSVPAQELKRRGLSAVESLVVEGPVEIIKRNRPACVVVSVGLFRELTEKRPRGRRRLVSDLFARPAAGKRRRREIDTAIREERSGWSGR